MDPRPLPPASKYIAPVRDGSDNGRLVSGYWCTAVYAYWGKGRITLPEAPGGT